MFSIEKCSLPDDALLARYIRDDSYTDCFKTDVSGEVSHVEYVSAFYTTWLFKLERLILKWLVSKPSTNAEAVQLAEGVINYFAAWSVEGRSENQILLCDYQGRTRSWLMVSPLTMDDSTATRLYFGSAITPVRNPRTGQMSLGLDFRMLLGFHKIYSRVLIYTSKSRLKSHNQFS